jgi:hypothetical protein
LIQQHEIQNLEADMRALKSYVNALQRKKYAESRHQYIKKLRSHFKMTEAQIALHEAYDENSHFLFATVGVAFKLLSHARGRGFLFATVGVAFRLLSHALGHRAAPSPSGMAQQPSG